MLRAPLISALTLVPVAVLYNPLLTLLPENVYLTGFRELYVGTLSLSKKLACEV